MLIETSLTELLTAMLEVDKDHKAKAEELLDRSTVAVTSDAGTWKKMLIIEDRQTEGRQKGQKENHDQSPKKKTDWTNLEDRSAGITIGQVGGEAGLRQLKARKVIIRIIYPEIKDSRRETTQKQVETDGRDQSTNKHHNLLECNGDCVENQSC